MYEEFVHFDEFVHFNVFIILDITVLYVQKKCMHKSSGLYAHSINSAGKDMDTPFRMLFNFLLL